MSMIFTQENVDLGLFNLDLYNIRISKWSKNVDFLAGKQQKTIPDSQTSTNQKKHKGNLLQFYIL